MRRHHARHVRGFTLVELLVVIGIIAVLIAILLPILAGAQRSARDVKCKSNIRQVCAALLNYAVENKGKFPPNVDRNASEISAGLRPQLWYDQDRIGRFLPGGTTPVTGSYWFVNSVLAPVLSCPSDDGGTRSYAMNGFASSAVNHGNGDVMPPDFPRAGQAWGPETKGAASLLLVLEALSMHPDGRGGWMCLMVVPMTTLQMYNTSNERFYPGHAFIGTVYGFVPTGDGRRFTPTDTEVDWGRHRRRSDGGTRRSENRGRANFGFADGHVADFTPDDLADRRNRRSKFVALWSPADYYVERLPRPNGF